MSPARIAIQKLHIVWTPKTTRVVDFLSLQEEPPERIIENLDRNSHAASSILFNNKELNSSLNKHSSLDRSPPYSSKDCKSFSLSPVLPTRFHGHPSDKIYASQPISPVSNTS